MLSKPVITSGYNHCRIERGQAVLGILKKRHDRGKTVTPKVSQTRV